MVQLLLSLERTASSSLKEPFGRKLSITPCPILGLFLPLKEWASRMWWPKPGVRPPKGLASEVMGRAGQDSARQERDGMTLCLSCASTRIGSRESPKSCSPENGTEASLYLCLAPTCHWQSHRSHLKVTFEAMAFDANLAAFNVASAENPRAWKP